MAEKVSKSRAKKTKTREKQAVKVSNGTSSILKKPWIGLVTALVLWVTAVLLLDAKRMLCSLPTIEALFPIAGNAAFLLVTLLATGLFLKITGPKDALSNSRIILLASISLISILPIKGLLYFSWITGLLQPETMGGFLLPLAMAPLLGTILVSSTAGIAVGSWTSLVAALMVGGDITVFITGMVVSIVTSQVAANIRTRSRIIRTGMLIGLIEISCVFGTTALNWNSAHYINVFHMSSACLISGFFAAAITLLILPLFELIFHITTDITLLEYSDLSHPLLQKLAIEAPGTYHHSLIVANLAQAAAEEIDANSLRARICSYFHDIGKLVKPEFFTENTQVNKNPHDNLQPSMSTLVIIAHVKEGMSLGMIHKLPKPIMDVIREHHGTSLLSYFHRKAQSQLELELEGEDAAQIKGQKVDDRDFRYSGPKPSTKESAIICLADGIEAASRTMEKTTPGHIENLVDEITNIRLEDDQLSECELTLAELTKVKRSFVFTLTNMLHGRVPYPKDENSDKQPAKTSQSKQAEGKDSDAPRNGKSKSSGK